jgi:phosphatidylserine/phosphatidylglycerophosphate/cardiolipin synthase-like enzyme
VAAVKSTLATLFGFGALFLVHCGGGESPPPANDPSAAASADAAAPPAQSDPIDAGTVDSTTRPPNTACNPTDPRTGPVVLSVLPDESEKPFVDLLQTAHRSIRVFGYQMGYGGVLDTLTAKAKAGVDVRVILDGNTQRTVNEKYRVALVGAGAKFEWSQPQFSYMHAKTIVVDEQDAIVSTSNYSLSFINKERNYLARITDAQDVADLVALFEADWSQSSPVLSCTRLLVSPVNSEARLVDLVKSAGSTLLIESMQFDDRAVHDAVLERKAAGVDVRVILADPSWISANAGAGADLVAHGIQARYLTTPAVHVKSMVVDGKRAYLGSENISWTSLTKNREIGVVITDAPALTTMGTTFDADWTAATSF